MIHDTDQANKAQGNLLRVSRTVPLRGFPLSNFFPEILHEEEEESKEP